MNVIKINQRKNVEPIIKKIAETVKQGKVICYPTDTVYGLGANVYDKNVIERIYQIKRREKNHPFSIIIGNVLDLKELIEEIHHPAIVLMEKFWPGALTLIFKSSLKLKDKLPVDRENIGVRLPNNKICGFLTKFCGYPIISTSANLSGGKAPYSIEEIPQEIKTSCDIIIDTGKIRSKGESTVIDVSTPIPKIIREGGIPMEEIRKYIKI
jgi:L-threonylcarbamoyladenylate synthase